MHGAKQSGTRWVWAVTLAATLALGPTVPVVLAAEDRDRTIITTEEKSTLEPDSRPTLGLMGGGGSDGG